MNETKITKRQEKILDLLALETLSRTEISARLKDEYLVSRPTLIRELNKLIDLGLIRSKGTGKKTVYASLQNPLLKYINIKSYFEEDSSLRKKVKNSFNFDIFDYLEDIFSEKEYKSLNKLMKSLSKQEKKMDPTIFKREIERFTVEFSWKSSKIEGNTYSLLETDILIKQMKEAEGHPKYEATMILNHKYAIDYILQKRERFRKLSLKKILELHKILTKDLYITPDIRKTKVAITGTNYLPLSNKASIKRALKKTIKLINKVEYPLTKALAASCMIAYIQPFADGNKRTTRTLMNAILLANDLYPLSYRDVREANYIEAMLLFYEQNSLYHLKRIFLEQLKFTVENYFRI